jgi:hypothetical protein
MGCNSGLGVVEMRRCMLTAGTRVADGTKTRCCCACEAPGAGGAGVFWAESDTEMIPAANTNDFVIRIKPLSTTLLN